jgi:hypothetical protein
MQIKWVQVSVKAAKRWALFLFLCSAVAFAIFWWIRPKGGQEAEQAVQEAKSALREAAEIVQQTQDPQDATFLEMASDALDAANTAAIENDYRKMVEQARRSQDFSRRIADRIKSQDGLANQVRFDEVIGEVMVRRADAKDYQPANKKMVLSPGDVIKTSPKSSCRVLFKDGMTTIISPNSLVTLKEAQDAASGGQNLIHLRLDTGNLTLRSSELASQGKPSIVTKSGSALVYHSSEVAISYSAIQTNTSLAVYEGKATAATGAKTMDVLKNQQVVFGDDQSLGSLVDLPPAPKLVRPENYTKIQASGAEVAVTLGWAAVDATASYRVELSPNILFTEFIHETDQYFRNQIEYANLSSGVYFWRVSAVNSQSAQGAPSQTWQFQIGEALVSEMRTIDNKPPPLKIEKVSVHGFHVIISGHTEVAAVVQVDGERAMMDAQTGKFNFIASMKGLGQHKINVVAIDQAGNRANKEITVQIRD